MNLKKGDLFVVRTHKLRAGLIVWFQKHLLSMDDDAVYDHAGIIVNSDGTTFESQMVIGEYKLEDYRGCKIYIVRHRRMTENLFRVGLSGVEEYRGCSYPFWRLLLYVVKLADDIHLWTFPVCSELVGIFLHEVGLIRSEGWGHTPDDFADLWDKSDDYEVIYKGVLE